MFKVDFQFARYALSRYIPHLIKRWTPVLKSACIEAVETVAFRTIKLGRSSHEMLLDGCKSGSTFRVRAAIRDRVNVNTPGMDDYTALHFATCNGHKEIVEFLLKNGADINAKDSNGLTPLHWAARNGYLQIVNLLVQEEADIHAKDKKEWTALHWAALKGHLEIVDFLISQGADSTLTNKDGDTPYTIIWELEGEIKANNLFQREPTDYEKDLINLFYLSHNIHIPKKVTLHSKKISTESVRGKIMFRYLARTHFDLIKNHSENFERDMKALKEIQEALNFAAHESSPKAYAKRAKASKKTFVNTGWNQHAIALYFERGRFYIINRGPRGNHKTIEDYVIDLSKATPEIFDEIVSVPNASPEQALKYFYETLPQKLSKDGKIQKTPLSKLLDKPGFPPKDQNRGNCSMANIAAALLVAFLDHSEESLNEENIAENFKRAKALHKISSYFRKRFVYDEISTTGFKTMPKDDQIKVFARAKEEVGVKALFKAFDAGNFSLFKIIINRLIEEGNDINALSYNGRNIFKEAVFQKKFEIVEFLHTQRRRSLKKI